MRLLVVAALLLGGCAETPRVIGGASPTVRPASPAPTSTPTATPTPPPRTASPAASPTPTPRTSPPSATSPSSTPSRTPASSAALPSQPPQPTLPPGTTALYSGERRFALTSGERREFDPVALAREDGRSAPPCASLAWTSAWHATEPLRAAWIRDGARNELGAGRWGTSSLGSCSTLELRNEGSATVDARIVFTIGSR